MGDQAIAAGIEDRIVLFQAAGDVVGIEDRHLRGAFEARAAHHADIHPGDRQDAGAAERCGADRAFGVLQRRMARQERRQVRLDTDRADARAATTVRDAEGLVQVQVRDVAAELAGAHRPTMAFMLAPSMYTWPPLSWMIAQISPIASSNTPWVDG